MRRHDLVGWALPPVALVVLLGVNATTQALASPVPAALAWAGCLWLLCRSSGRGVLSLESLYLALLGLFHLGMVVPDALGAHPDPSPPWLGSPFVGPSLRLFSTAAVAFTLGATLTGPERDDAPERLAAQGSLFGFGLAVALGGAAMIGFGAWRIGLFQGSYGEFFERSVYLDVRFFGLGMMLFPVGLLVSAAGATPRQMFLLGALLAVVCGPLFASGFRGPIVTQAAALVTVWARKDAATARRLAAVAVVGLLVAVPVIKLTRVREASFSEAIRKARGLDFVLESGGSLYPLVATHDLLRQEPLWWGRSYAMALERVVPNVSSTQRTSDTRLTPSAWVTLHMSPWEYEHGGGLGFSGVAEPYLNFGAPGVLLFFLLGGFLARTADRALQGNPFVAATVVSCFGFVLWTVRNDMMTVFRMLAYAAVVVGGIWLADRLLRRPRVA